MNDLLTEIKRLMEKKLTDSGINIQTNCSPIDLLVNVDEKLISQVLLNLVQNSFISTTSDNYISNKEHPFIKITACTDNNHNLIVEVEDNGPGIPKELYDKIFIPFFTTHEKGSGIGLSLCRQIIQLHGGSINLKSKPGIKTVFSLKF